MKRVSALVDYESSSDDDTGLEPSTAPTPPIDIASPPPPAKKPRKLPSLAAHLQIQAPIDNPALHQGRKRNTPHVEGQWAAYVYIPLVVSKRSRLFDLLLRIFASARQTVPSLHPIGLTTTDVTVSNEDIASTTPERRSQSVELHISLTRPVYLRVHQRDDFKRAVREVSRSRHRFSASFATLSELTNDERTRTFLTLEIGAGHDELQSIAEALGPTLRSLRQQEFYQDPRFHASIAWALLDNVTDSSATSPKSPTPAADPATKPTSSGETPGGETEPTFITIPHFPFNLVSELQQEFRHELVKTGVGAFEVEEIHVRIGKDVSRWKLS